MNLSHLNAEVGRELQGKQPEIIGRMFDRLKIVHMKKSDCSDCECSYCVALRAYVGVKLQIRRLRRLYDQDTYSYLYRPLAREEQDARISSLQLTASQARAQKNRMKLLTP